MEMTMNKFCNMNFKTGCTFSSHFHFFKPASPSPAHKKKLISMRAPLPPLIPPTFVESPRIKEDLVISPDSMPLDFYDYQSEEEDSRNFNSSNLFHIDLLIRDHWEILESMTLFWQDKLNNTEQDLKEQIQKNY